MTVAEQEALLAVTRRHPRDHILVSLALGTGLRLRELLGLNVGDVTADGKTIRARFPLDPAITKNGQRGEVFVPSRLARKLQRYLRWKQKAGEPTAADSPLFASQHGNRLSKRRTQQILRQWQVKAGLDRYYGFHCLRHSAITNVYRATKDVLLTQRFARHSHLATTTAYTHPSDEDLQRSVQTIRC
jgi:site-specific recombinase XerC